MGSLMDWYHQNVQGFQGLSGIGTLGGSFQNSQQNYLTSIQNQGMVNYATSGISYLPYSSIPTISVKAPSPKTGRILIDLRTEIDQWHGDVLRSKP